MERIQQATTDFAWTTSPDFKPLEELGHGSFGTVWKSVYKDGNYYAIKKINMSRALRHFDNVEQILREVENHSKINSSFIVKYYSYWTEAAGSEDGNYSDDSCISSGNYSSSGSGSDQKDIPLYMFIQMEFCNEISLTQYLIDTDSIGMRSLQLRRIVNKLCKGLMAIHSQGIIHRDIKPDNIICTKWPGSKKSLWKIADFGLSIKTEEKSEKNHDNDDQNPTFAGTLNYRSPEMLQKRMDYSEKTDVFSLGLVLLELLCPSLSNRCTKIESFNKLQKRLEDPGRVISSQMEKETGKFVNSSCIDLIQSMLIYNSELRIDSRSAYEHSIYPILQGVESAVSYFTGREKELALLHSLFSLKTASQIWITGDVGVGKSALIEQFIHTLKTKENNFDPKCCICWLNGGSPILMKESILRIAEEFDVPTRKEGAINYEREMQDIFTDVIDTVKKFYSSFIQLFIIDNVDNELEVEYYINACKDANIVIVVILSYYHTTPSAPNTIHLNELSRSEAWEMMVMSISDNDDFLDLGELCTRLHNNPFCLQQLIRLCRVMRRITKYSISNFIQDYDKFMEINPGDFPSEISKHICITGCIIIEKLAEINSPDFFIGYRIMNILAYALPIGVSAMFLCEILALMLTRSKHINENNENQMIIEIKDLAAPLLLLKRLNLLQDYEFGVHVITRGASYAVRRHLKSADFEKQILGDLFNCLQVLKPSTEVNANIIHVWGYLSNYPEVIKTKFHLVQKFLRIVGNFSQIGETLQFCESVVGLAKLIWGGESLEYLSLLNDVGCVYEKCGRGDLSVATFETVQNSANNTLGFDHWLTIFAMENKAAALRLIDTETAIKGDLVKIELDGVKENMDGKTEHSLVSSYNAAVNYCRLNELNKGLDLMKCVLREAEALDNDSNLVHSIRHGISCTNYKLDRLDDAMKECKLVLDARIRLLGEESSDTLETKELSAEIHVQLGNAKEAVGTLQHVLNVQKRRLGNSHAVVHGLRDKIETIRGKVEGKFE